MKQLIFTLFTCQLLVAGVVSGQSPPEIEWQRAIGGSLIDYPGAVLTAVDGYFIAGLTGSTDGDVSVNYGGTDAWLVKLDLDGNIVWEKTYGSSGNDGFYSLAFTPDGNILAGGYVGANDADVTGFHGALDFWIVKLDPDGNLIWQTTLGGSNYEIVSSCIQLTDGNILATGYTGSNDGDVTGLHGAYDYWVVKIDAFGELLWQKTFGGTSTDWPYDATETKDGNYLVTGYTTSKDGDVSFCRGGNDAWVVKVSADGALLWEQPVGKRGGESLNAVVQIPAGAFMLAGHSSSQIPENYGSNDFMLCRLTSNGEIKWAKNFGGEGWESAYDLLRDDDGGFVLTGHTDSYNTGDVSGHHGEVDIWMIKTASNGSLLWQKCLGGSLDDAGFGINKTEDGGYIIVGYSMSADGDLNTNHGGQDIWVVKLSPDVFRALNETTENETILVYPNPGNGAIHIMFAESGYLMITDVTGKTIAEGPFNGNEIINTASWPVGVYSITLRTETEQVQQIFINSK